MTFVTSAGDGRGERVAWVDYAKGICTVAVVCMYAAYYRRDANGAGWMQYFVDFARPFRMPDFFLISGLFLARTIDRPWRDFADKKIVHFVYFLVLWTTIYFVAEWLLSDNLVGKQPLWTEYLRWYINPYHMLWFIAILPVFFVVTRLLRSVPWWIVFPVAAALQIVAYDTGWPQINRFEQRYVYFYAGYAFAPLAFRATEWARQNPGMSLLLLALWAVINEAFVLARLHEDPGYSIVLGFAGATAVMVVASLLQKYRAMDWLRYIGRNSIVVFLAFYLPMVAAAKLLWRVDLVSDIGTQVLIVTVIAVAAPLVLHRLGKGTPAQYLFERPRWARRRPEPHGALAGGAPAGVSVP